MKLRLLNRHIVQECRLSWWNWCGDIWEFSIKFIKQRHITKITMKKVLNQSFVNNRANWFQYLRQKIPNAKTGNSGLPHTHTICLPAGNPRILLLPAPQKRGNRRKKRAGARCPACAPCNITWITETGRLKHLKQGDGKPISLETRVQPCKDSLTLTKQEQGTKHNRSNYLCLNLPLMTSPTREAVHFVQTL